MIYVNIEANMVKLKGTAADIAADVCIVLDALCDETGLPPEFVIAMLKDTFLNGRKRMQEEEDDDEPADRLKDMIQGLLLDAAKNTLAKGVKEDDEDERSKKTVQSPRRRSRRRLD